MRYKDKLALVTAAANGIGRATCEIIAREGGIVVATASTPVRLLSNGSLGQSNGSALPAIGFSSVVANVAVAPVRPRSWRERR